MTSFGNSIGLDKGYDAEDAITAYRAVKVGATAQGVLPISSVSDIPIGISLFTVTLDEITRGKGASVRRGGIAEWEAGGAFNRGDKLTIDSVGRCVGVTAGDVAASLATGVVGSNNAITWTAKTPGPSGNSITVTLVDPGGTTAALSVDVANNGLDITVSLARAASALSSTAQNVIDAIQANGAANALVSVANTSTSTGAGIVAAVSKTALAGGAGDIITYAIAEQASTGAGIRVAALLKLVA
jgi:hypothetical protein